MLGSLTLTGDSVALVVNNLGGTSVLELNIVSRAAINYSKSLSFHNLGIHTSEETWYDLNSYFFGFYLCVQLKKGVSELIEFMWEVL